MVSNSRLRPIYTLPEHYGADDAAISRYVQSAKTEEGFRRFLDEWLGVAEATA